MSTEKLYRDYVADRQTKAEAVVLSLFQSGVLDEDDGGGSDPTKEESNFDPDSATGKAANFMSSLFGEADEAEESLPEPTKNGDKGDKNKPAKKDKDEKKDKHKDEKVVVKSRTNIGSQPSEQKAVSKIPREDEKYQYEKNMKAKTSKMKQQEKTKLDIERRLRGAKANV